MCNGPEDPCPACGRRGESTTESQLVKVTLYLVNFAEAWLTYNESKIALAATGIAGFSAEMEESAATLTRMSFAVAEGFKEM